MHMPYVSNEVFGDANSFNLSEFAMTDFDSAVLEESIERQIDLFLGLLQGTTQTGIPENGACWGVQGKFIEASSGDIDDAVVTMLSYAGITSTMIIPTGKLPPDDLIAYAGCIYLASELVTYATSLRQDGRYEAAYKLIIRQGP